MSEEIKPPASRDVISFVTRQEDKMPGAAYGFHPKSVIRGPFVFVDEWHINKHSAIYKAEDASQGFKAPANSREASISGWKSEAIPRPKAGKLIDIYWSGRWRPEATEADRAAVLEILNADQTR